MIEKFSRTCVRKATVINTREKCDKEKRELATITAHTVSNADAHYSLQNKINMAPQGHDSIRRLYGSPFKSPVQKSTETPTKAEKIAPSTIPSCTTTSMVPPIPPQKSGSYIVKSKSKA